MERVNFWLFFTLNLLNTSDEEYSTAGDKQSESKHDAVYPLYTIPLKALLLHNTYLGWRCGPKCVFLPDSLSTLNTLLHLHAPLACIKNTFSRRSNTLPQQQDTTWPALHKFRSKECPIFLYCTSNLHVRMDILGDCCVTPFAHYYRPVAQESHWIRNCHHYLAQIVHTPDP